MDCQLNMAADGGALVRYYERKMCGVAKVVGDTGIKRCGYRAGATDLLRVHVLAYRSR
jgi:hypothetical protein